MKVISKLSMIVVFLSIVACSGITIEMNKDPSSEAIVSILSRRLAFHGAIKFPGMIEPGIEFCNSLISYNEQGDIKALMLDVIAHIEVVKEDPLLMADIKDLAELINLQVDQPLIELNEKQIKLLKLGADAFRTGLLLAKEKANG